MLEVDGGSKTGGLVGPTRRLCSSVLTNWSNKSKSLRLSACKSRSEIICQLFQRPNPKKSHTNVAMMPRKKLTSNWQQDQDEGCSLDSSSAVRPLSPHSGGAEASYHARCSKIPFIKKGSLPPTTWWETQQWKTISTWPPLMCVSELIVCLENKRGQEVFVVKFVCNNFVSSGCFKKVFFHHKDSLVPRTLFVIPHNFFSWGIMLSSFFKRVTPSQNTKKTLIPTASST